MKLTEGRKAKTLEDTFRMNSPLQHAPHGWIQWKGTDVCMDIRCACGEHTHIDTDFCYSIKCICCGRSYACMGHIELIELEQEPDMVQATFE